MKSVIRVLESLLKTDPYPLTFAPVFKDYLWGGRNLAHLFGRPLPDGPVAESWEIAAHEKGTTVIDNGPWAGVLLSELMADMGPELVGSRAAWALSRGKFPLLIKLLDAHQPLSVQVHPDDDFARAHEGHELGKTEMWLIVHAEPEAAILLGVKADATAQTLRAAITTASPEAWLHRIAVRAGDYVCVPAGSLHAILGGLVIAEIQQNSDSTYRIYDWNRLDLQGSPRPLHIDKAMAVINFDQVEPALPVSRLEAVSAGLSVERLCQNSYFAVERWHMAEGATYHGRCDGATLEIWGVIHGQATIIGGQWPCQLAAIRFSLLPATMGAFTVSTPVKSTLLRVYLPESDPA